MFFLTPWSHKQPNPNVLLVWLHSQVFLSEHLSCVASITHPQEGSVILCWNKLFLCSLSLTHPIFLLISEGTRCCSHALCSSWSCYCDDACSCCDPACSESNSHCTAHEQRPSQAAWFQLPHGFGQREFWQGAWKYINFFHIHIHI